MGWRVAGSVGIIGWLWVDGRASVSTSRYVESFLVYTGPAGDFVLSTGAAAYNYCSAIIIVEFVLASCNGCGKPKRYPPPQPRWKREGNQWPNS